MTQKHFETKQAEVSDTKLIETIETKLSKLCQTGGRSLSLSVPPQVSDIDMAICELIRRYKQLIITDVVVNEAEKEFKPCGEGDNICKCKDASECGYSSEVALCGVCDKPQVKVNGQVCADCISKTQQKHYT